MDSEYVYAAAILHELDREINEENMKTILEAAGASVSESSIKALIAALEGIDLREAAEKAAGRPVPGGEEAAGEMEGGTEETTEGLPEPTEEEEDTSSGDDLDDMFS